MVQVEQIYWHNCMYRKRAILQDILIMRCNSFGPEGGWVGSVCVCVCGGGGA